jgi:hypothetical protein
MKSLCAHSPTLTRHASAWSAFRGAVI